MNSFCRSIARKACAREQQRRLASLQSHYYATSAKTRSTKPPKAADSTATTPFPPPPPPIYTTFTPASGGPKPAPSSPPPSPAASANVEWARPSEVPFQAKVANSVHLIGYVSVPVQFQTSPDGKAWASAIISTQCPSSSDDSHTPPLV